MTDTATALSNWMPQVLGRYINEDWNPQNQGFGAQCWDIPANWARYLGLPRISTASAGGRWPGWAGNMADTFPQNPDVAAAYELLHPSARVQGGDTLVWDDSNRVWFPKTHTAVAVTDLGDWLDCISQNSSPTRPDNPYPQWTTGPTIRQRLPRRGLLGIIRPRAGSTDPLPTPIIEALGDRMATLDKDDLAAIRTIAVDERKTTVLEVRANAVATVNAVADLLEDAVFKLSVFTQKTDNQNTDRSIDDFRANLKAGLAEIAAQHAAEEEGK